ncbi:ATP-dependent protease La [Clostridium bornimense]|uniref:endopeptidase La n=1 Tax=Clostridium bornimense TaxID=1216932 RepID=W6RVP3_9CLOT|nr:AAA family ATPase [Clostridium bornimense]CDM68771.1 ATP-dependent protease La [Clostridium bornimense]
MKKLSYDDISLKVSISKDEDKSYYDSMKNEINKALSVNKKGFNLFFIDNYSNYCREKLIEIVEEYYSEKEAPKDICYVVLKGSKNPYGMKVKNGYGIKIKNKIEDIKEELKSIITNFLSDEDIEEKNVIVEKYKDDRDLLIDKLLNISKESGFELDFNDKGFAFTPVLDGKLLSEEEFNKLDEENRENILDNLEELKAVTESIVKDIGDIDDKENKELEDIFIKEISDFEIICKDEIEEEFIDESEGKKYLLNILSIIIGEIIEKKAFKDEESGVLSDILKRIHINVIVDNSEKEHPPVYFEDDPNISNLFGRFESESVNGSYITDISMLRPGAILKANEGCLILRADDLISYPQAYQYLKNFLYSGKVGYKITSSIDYMTLNGFMPEEIEVNTKIILIGDYDTFETLYNIDSDFKNIFRIKIFNNKILEKRNFIIILEKFKEICKKNSITIEDESIYLLILKSFMRRNESKEKIVFDYEFLENIAFLACEDNNLSYKSVYDYLFREDEIEKQYFESYKNKDVFISVKGEKIGEINALSVIDGGDFSFGKPIKVTCVCSKGKGNILDSHKESYLSGKIHSKSILILKGAILRYLDGYYNLPIDFHISFEQLYSNLEGDSASVAEFLSMISAITKIPLKQNIAITGSMNQMGEIQPIGGVNEKIEGFFKACNLVDTYEDKGVLIPRANVRNLVLNNDVEEAIREGTFSLYIMENIDDAIEIMFSNYERDQVINIMRKEMMKYM